MKSEDLVTTLRAIASFYEANPSVTAPYIDAFHVFVDKPEQLAEIAKLLGKCQKGADDNYFFLKKHFGVAYITFNVRREVACERVVVGHRQVDEQVIPAHVEEVVEWHCHPILKEREEQDERLLEESVPLEAEGADEGIPF